jgi:plastocyanin
MKGARAVAGWMLILIAVCVVPAVSAAQGTETATETATTPEPAADPAEPAADPAQPAADPAQPAADPVVELGEAPADAEPAVEQQLQAEPAPSPPPAPAPRSGKAKASASASVSIGDNFYSPARVSIAVGDIVSWTNNGQAQHSATADDGSFDTGVFGPDASRSHTFTRAGTFSYYCTVHGQAQSGTVRVLAAAGGGSGGGGAPTTSATGDSEAAAVASPDAAGTSTTLPATGMAAGVLALVGLALVASGSLVGRAGANENRQSRFLTIF